MVYCLVHSFTKMVFSFFVDFNFFITCNFFKVLSFCHLFPATCAKERHVWFDMKVLQSSEW